MDSTLLRHRAVGAATARLLFDPRVCRYILVSHAYYGCVDFSCPLNLIYHEPSSSLKKTLPSPPSPNASLFDFHRKTPRVFRRAELTTSAGDIWLRLSLESLAATSRSCWSLSLRRTPSPWLNNLYTYLLTNLLRPRRRVPLQWTRLRPQSGFYSEFTTLFTTSAVTSSRPHLLPNWLSDLSVSR